MPQKTMRKPASSTRKPSARNAVKKPASSMHKPSAKNGVQKKPAKTTFREDPQAGKVFSNSLLHCIYIYIYIHISSPIYIYNIYLLFRSYWAVMWMTRVTLKCVWMIGLTLDAPKFGSCGRTWRCTTRAIIQLQTLYGIPILKTK